MIVIETDLEPDDLVAIYQIIQSKPKDYPFSFVVGEGSSRFKEKLLRLFLSTFLPIIPSNLIIIQGIDSHEPYPIAHLPKEWLNLDDISTLPLPIRYKNTKISCYFLKPPREALLLKNDLQKSFQHITCFAYGGFNYRVLLTTNIDEINQLASCFKQYYHFSRKVELEFGQDLYLLHSILNRHDSFAQFLKICIKNWNLHYIERFQPNEEITHKIMENLTIQVVMADVLCATVPEKWKVGKLINDDQIVLREGEGEKIVFVSGMSREDRSKQVRKSLDLLFENETLSSSKQSFL